jgi:hypothetical protein
MIKLKTKDYFKALEIGFDYYGLNGLFEMHKDVCDNPDNPWAYGLTVLNDLTYKEFEEIAAVYLKNIK